MMKNKEWAVHGLIIITALGLLNYKPFNLTFGIFSSGDQTFLWPSIIGTVINLTLFYGIVFYLVPEVLRKQKLTKFISALFLLFFILSFIEIGIDARFAKSFYGTVSSQLWNEIVLLVIVIHLLTLIFALAYRFTKDWFANERLQRGINEWKLKTELELLKSQINPHFLLNALNSLFSLALQNKDEQTAEGISKLSEMMRFVFDKAGDEKVTLADEIQYIEVYLYMQQLRFEERVNVSFDYPETGKEVMLAPMLFIPFIENAFKYGVGTQKQSNIHIKIDNSEGIDFYIESNVVEKKEAIPSSGIGISNVKKRLELMYLDKHVLKIKEEEDKFKVSLKIQTL
jgi:sensor histidine kinase YesM